MLHENSVSEPVTYTHSKIMTTISLKPNALWLMHTHDLCYVLMGLVLLVYPTQSSQLYTCLLGSLLLLAGLSTAGVSIRRRQMKQTDNYWFILSGIRDTIFGFILLITSGGSLKIMVNVLGMWGIMYAFLQAIEALFYFLGTRSNADKDYGVEFIHFFCVLIAGGFAFTLVMRPEGLQTSLGFVGLFLVGLGIIQAILTQRLWHLRPKAER